MDQNLTPLLYIYNLTPRGIPKVRAELTYNTLSSTKGQARRELD